MSRLVNEYGEPIEDDDLYMTLDSSQIAPSYIVHKVDLMDETVDKIAEAVVRKMKEKAGDDSDYELVPYTGTVYVRRRRKE